MASYCARDAERLEEEDTLLSILDRVWLDMTQAERAQIDEVARKTRQNYRIQQQTRNAWIREVHASNIPEIVRSGRKISMFASAQYSRLAAA
jgi:hypothetical protein